MVAVGSGMRACTAALIELRHNERDAGPKYRGEAHFLSQAEWEGELDLAGWLLTVENLHSTDVESPPPPIRVCMNIQPTGKSCSYLGRVCVFSMTLLPSR